MRLPSAAKLLSDREWGDVTVAQTSAEANIMASTAAKFDQTEEGLRSMLQRLLNELEILGTHWVGQSGRSFTQVKEAFEGNMKKLSAALSETATAIRNSGTTYTSTDDESAGKVGGIDTSINLAL
jgi:WXG100 family type VII secretion target